MSASALPSSTTAMPSGWSCDGLSGFVRSKGLVGVTLLLIIATSSCSVNKASKSLPEIQGHRGCRGLMPENTIPAFLHALDLGVPVLELDVCISADQQVVVSHEPWISSLICRPGPGADVPFLPPHPPDAPEGEPAPGEPHFGQLPYALISEYDCGSLVHPRFPEQRPRQAIKPLLREVLRATEAHAASLGRTVAYNIELKARPEWDNRLQPPPDSALPLLLAEFERAGLGRRVTLQSFDYRVLQKARELQPDLILAHLVADNPDLDQELDRLGFTPEIYSPWFGLVDAALLRKARARGMRVIPWTVNEPADMQHLLELGVDGLITDYPNRALALPPLRHGR
jgi:glycerophosphoryl diester phosphodiesterase